ncbi:hypothetical protein [Azospirillum sp. sgz301742]
MGVQEQHRKAMVRWILADGDRTLRLVHPLGADSVVFDIGGKAGDWAAAITTLHGCACHVFAPYAGSSDGVRRRFEGDSRITVHGFALGRGDGAFQESAALGAAPVIAQQDIAAFVRDRGIARIDLMQLDAAGAEYDLLAHVVESGLISIVESIQVRFHPAVEGADHKREALARMLSLTHELVYDFPFVWESWSACRGD